jgi:hypothetical protein
VPSHVSIFILLGMTRTSASDSFSPCCLSLSARRVSAGSARHRAATSASVRFGAVRKPLRGANASSDAIKRSCAGLTTKCSASSRRYNARARPTNSRGTTPGGATAGAVRAIAADAIGKAALLSVVSRDVRADAARPVFRELASVAAVLSAMGILSLARGVVIRPPWILRVVALGMGALRHRPGVVRAAYTRAAIAAAFICHVSVFLVSDRSPPNRPESLAGHWVLEALNRLAGTSKG